MLFPSLDPAGAAAPGGALTMRTALFESSRHNATPAKPQLEFFATGLLLGALIGVAISVAVLAVY